MSGRDRHLDKLAMQFHIKGAHRETGQDVVIAIEAYYRTSLPY